MVSSAGSGATVPYLFVFLDQERGLGVGEVGALLTVRAVGAVAGSVLGGAWSDRLGARRAALLILVAAAVSTAALLAVCGTIVGVLLLSVYGVVGSALGSALNALLGQIAPEHRRGRVFSINYAAINAGGAAGALLAAIALTAWPGSGYTVLFAGDAASFVVLAVVVWRWVPCPHLIAPGQIRRRRSSGGYRAVARDGTMRRLCGVTAVVVGGGFCQLQVGIPAIATARNLPGSALGWVFAANMVAVVALQAPLRTLSRNWRRTTCLIAGIVAVAVAWLFVAAAPQAGVPGLALAAVVFAAGAVLLSPVLAALVNDIAPNTLRGRYNGAHILAWTSGWLAGTALTGLLLVTGGSQLLFPTFTLLIVFAAVVALRLRRHLSALIDRPLPANRPDPKLELTG
ncbi:MFS transporter [Streptomyces sp. NPDC060085]|uniref:MFS transporter n=1 Tax=Streptomyces sp. NPDC060085 TaxID=3347054 RepID=UPI0036674136